jgi:hypothetical protein
MLSLFKKLFAGKPASTGTESLRSVNQEQKPVSGTETPTAQTSNTHPQPPQAVSLTERSLQVPASEFAKCAATGPAWSRLSIRNIPQVITELHAEMDHFNIPAADVFDFFNNSLLGVCPECNEYCAGKAFLNMPLMAEIGNNVMFTGNSGGFERMLQGRCLNYSCSSMEFDLFWCPDLDSRMLRNLQGRGINLDPDVQRKRNHLWQPRIGRQQAGQNLDSVKQQSKVITIKGSSGKETSFEFCRIPEKDFYLGKYPVTQQQWEAVMGYNPSYFKGGSLPVETVYLDDAQTFIEKLNTLTGKKLYRLPTEAEWEYACRAGTTSEYYFGDDESQLGEHAWYDGNSGNTTHPVGKKKPNGWGLYDMAGNVWEWTESWYDSSRSYQPADQRHRTATMCTESWYDSLSYRVIRGGCWGSLAVYCRLAYRGSRTPDYRDYTIGFRLVFVP